MNMKLLVLTALPLSILFACGEKESDTSETTEDTGEETTEDTGEEEPAVDVYANGAAVVNDAAFPGGTGYLTVPVGDYTFEVAPAGTTGRLDAAQ